MSQGRRADRVGELLRAHLAELLRELGDPRLAGAVITTLEVSDDLSFARVGVRPLALDHDSEKRKSMLRALARVTPRLRRALGPRLDLRKVPELVFGYDSGPDKRERVEELLREIAAERAEPEDSEEREEE